MMGLSIQSPSVLLTLFLSFMISCNGVHVFDVYRMFQMEKGSIAFGSQKANINLLATSVNADKIDSLKTLNQLIVITPLEQFSAELLDKISAKNAQGLLVLLPHNESRLSSLQLTQWHSLERALLETHWKMPVYFTITDNTLRNVHQDSLSSSELINSGDRYQLVVSGLEPTAIKDVSVANFQGYIPAGSRFNLEERVTPTLAIVTYYDSFGIAPELSVGGGSSASNVVAIIELARMFSKLYSNPKTQGRYNILFVITGGGSLNFAGSKHWLSNADVRLLESIEFALCIDTIGSGDDLYLHVSKQSREENIQSIYKAFNETATDMGIYFSMVHKKINISSPDVDWEHEQFSRKKIPSATLSRLSSPLPTLSKSHIFDDKSQASVKILERNIKFIAEVFAKQIFDYSTRKQKEIEVFNGSLGTNNQFIESWLHTVTSVSRAVPYLPKNSPILSGISKILRQYTSESLNQTFTLDEDYVFFDGMKASMSAYRVKPPTFDAILAVIIGAYLLALFVFIKGPSEAIEQAKGLFAKKEKKYLTKKKI